MNKETTVYTRTQIHTYTHTGILFGHKNNEILPLGTTQMDPEDITRSENKPDREGQIPYDFTYVWNLKQQQDTENRQVVGRGRR